MLVSLFSGPRVLGVFMYLCPGAVFYYVCMRIRDDSENDLVFIKKRSFSIGKILNLMQRKL